jgi:hypothetical protein
VSTEMAGRGADLSWRSPCGMAAVGANRDTNTNTTSSESKPDDRREDRRAQGRCSFI